MLWIRLFMNCFSLSVYVQWLKLHRFSRVQSEANGLKINRGASLENAATALNFYCRPFLSPLDSDVMK